MIFNPIKSIKSRYSLTTVNNNYYQNQLLSGYTNNILIGNKSTSGITSGYVWVPYIMLPAPTIIIESEWQIKQLRKERKEKLKKIWSIQK